jgi:hypothetical protein
METGVLPADALSCCFCSLQNAVAFVIDEARRERHGLSLEQEQPPASSGRLQRAQMLRGLSSAAETEVAAAGTPDARGARP